MYTMRIANVSPPRSTINEAGVPSSLGLALQKLFAVDHQGSLYPPCRVREALAQATRGLPVASSPRKSQALESPRRPHSLPPAFTISSLFTAVRLRASVRMGAMSIWAMMRMAINRVDAYTVERAPCAPGRGAKENVQGGWHMPSHARASTPVGANARARQTRCLSFAGCR
eukprot:scaffold255832_cov33-Tisochrysis_lutea.AAC.1